MLQQLGANVVGDERVEWPEQPEPEPEPEQPEPEPEQPEPEQPVVVARAVCFPVLCQELSKGVMEILTMHGLSAYDEDTARGVIHYADRLEDEPWLIQVGPELWRKFLKVVPKRTKLADIVSMLSTLQPSEVNKVITAVIENPDEATEILQDLIRAELNL
jgi:hypothetical protein